MSFRILSLVLGILGSIAAFLLSGIFLLVYLAITLYNGFDKYPVSDYSNPPIIVIIRIFYFLAAGVLGSTGSISSLFKPRLGGAIQLVSGTAVLITFVLPILGQPFFSVFSIVTILSVGSTAMLLSGGFVALVEKRAQHSGGPTQLPT